MIPQIKFYATLLGIVMVMAVQGENILFAARAKGKIKANSLNVRLQPTTDAPVIARLAGQSVVEIAGETGEWYRVMLPPEIVVHVAAQFVINGKITREVNVRTAPGTEHPSYGLLPAGTPVKVLGYNNRRDWVKIAPPAGLTAFVSKKFVEITPEEAAKLRAPVPLAPAAQTNLPERLQEMPSELPRNAEMPEELEPVPPPRVLNAEERAQLFAEMSFIPESAKNVRQTGVVCELAVKDYAVTHALVELSATGSHKTLAFLYSARQNPGDFLNRTVRVEGIRRQVPDWKTPVIEVQSITPVER